MVCREATREQLQSLLEWLCRHGRHVLHLKLHTFEADTEEQSAGVVSALLDICVDACASSGQLEELTYVYGGGLQVDIETWYWGPTLAMLTNLQALRVEATDSSLQVTASLHPLTALRKLRLVSAVSLQVAPSVQLPARLEELELEDWSGAPLPKQASGGQENGWVCSYSLSTP